MSIANALVHQRRAREAYKSAENMREMSYSPWRDQKWREIQGWQRTSSRKAREYLFALLGEKS